MCSGDVLLSVNGESVEGLNHPKLVAKIQESKDTLRYSNNIQNITINSHHHQRVSGAEQEYSLSLAKVKHD